VKTLEDELATLRRKGDDMMLISKDDHRKFVDNLNSLHRQELKRSQDVAASH
jgi:hypothetical protein